MHEVVAVEVVLAAEVAVVGVLEAEVAVEVVLEAGVALVEEVALLGDVVALEVAEEDFRSKPGLDIVPFNRPIFVSQTWCCIKYDYKFDVVLVIGLIFMVF